MCDFFGAKKAAKKAERKAAAAEAEAKAAEAKRQADIQEGNTRIDSAFASYDPTYYTNFKNTFTSNYNPQIDEQYDRASDKAKAQLADRGMLDSSFGASIFGDLQKTRDDARVKAASDAESAAGELQTRIADRKSNLYALNLAAADPEGAAANATGAATALAAPPAYSPLGEVFANVLNNLNAFQSARANAAGPAYSYTPSSSYKVVR
jgi:hypothetical protein